MAYVVTEPCFGCKYNDCVVVCPCDCFREGDAMLYIDPNVRANQRICLRSMDPMPSHSVRKTNEDRSQWCIRQVPSHGRAGGVIDFGFALCELGGSAGPVEWLMIWRRHH